MPTPDLFFCLVLPIAIVIVGGIAGIVAFLRMNPATSNEHPHNPGGDPWGQQ